ncbi:MAG: TIM barrel protein [Tabrizicola sp.]|uniref:TIM barrel protein n=1 Tax=Tabrizicola sp. TaxID=2005166 RepID=UPI002ABB5BC1|nr:TIM barrel protein [Tabrizicola sp.]MDZ4085500.1 TIM barrel protein [Tabrizicola sp.]
MSHGTEWTTGQTEACPRHRAGSRLGHIHLQDADGFVDRHWQIGHGTILWQSVFAAIAHTCANPRLILELRGKEGVLPSAAHLRAMGLAE